MKLTWDEVMALFEEVKEFSGDTPLYWFRYVWGILEDANLTVCNSTAEAIYSKLYATISFV